MILPAGLRNKPTTGNAEMIRSELIQKIADENPHLYQRDVERIVNTIFDEIIEAMARGDRVELRGFGAFSVKKRDARLGRNPRTGQTVTVPAKRLPFFRVGKELKELVNQPRTGNNPRAGADDGVRWDKAPCRFCGTGCHVQVGTRNGRVVAIAGDQKAEVNKGLLCVKGYHVGLALYGKDRLTKPLLRKDGKLTPISWKEAIEIIANGLKISLDYEAGGDLAARLGALYDYMTHRLLYANLHNSRPALDEVTRLLNELKGAWEEIGSHQAQR